MKKVISLFVLVMAIMLCAVTAFGAETVASGYCGGEGDGTNLTWTLDSDGVLTISGSGKMEDYLAEISVIDGIMDIGNSSPWDNYRSQLKSLIIKEGVTYIGNYAFFNNIYGTKKATIPASVAKIGRQSFQNCGISEYYFDGNAPSVFAADDEKLSFDASDKIFYKKAASGWTLTNGKWNGYTAAASDAEPEEPKDYVQEFDPDDYIASGYCGASNNGNIIDNGKNIAWMIDSNGVLTIKGKGKMRNFSENYDSWITTAPWAKYLDKFNTLILEEGITQIGWSAFYGCSNITGKLVIPDSVTAINSSAFGRCSGFTGKLNLPNNLKTIAANAFISCRGFSGDLIIPDSVTSIGSSAFAYCEGFDGNLIIGNNVKSIGDEAFYGCENLIGNLIIPESVTSVGKGAFGSCEKLSGNLVIPDNVTYLGNRAFYNCSGFNGTLIIGKGVTTINNDTFRWCSRFKNSIVLHENITKISAEAFYGCGVDRFYFKSNAPVVIAATEEKPSFDFADDTIYYPIGNSTWEIIDGKWNGYNAKAYDPNAKVKNGDCNGDGVINARDSQRLYEHIVGKNPFVKNSDEYKAADVNGDGIINARDSQRLYEHIVGKDPLD